MSHSKKLKLCPGCGETVPRMTGHFQNGMRRAAQKGLIVVEPRANQLQLDIDGLRAYLHHWKQWEFLRKAGVGLRWYRHIANSRRKNHWHITVTMPRSMPILERIGLAAILGDDPVRAAMNWTRAVNRNKYPIVFFEQEKHENQCLRRRKHDTRKRGNKNR